ncbi:S8 family peptidase [Nonomuraea sp. NPDC050790]|uniref:S8 family peptidase n=1 Tax=Nonomuraea sp. NPDC050790 TaxID=3364371 RepID=UPI0037BB86FE
MDMQSAGQAIIRPGQLLVDRSATSAAGRWTQAVTEADGVCALRLTPGVDPCELALELRERGHRASPNHVFAGQPLFFGGPASRPFPAEAVPYRPGRERSPVVVGLLDTGVAPHPWWSRSEWYGELGQEGADATRGNQAGHGTFIAGLLVRRAPGVTLRVCRVLDGDGLGDEAGIVRALNRLRSSPRPVQVLNLSFGGHTFDDRPPPMLADALGALPGAVAVACAGNTASDRPVWPAALPSVIGVGALDAGEERRSPFSAHGPWVDACARGEWLASSYPGFEGYATWSGTSFATALVAGAVAALAKEAPAKDAAGQILAGDRQIPDLGVVVPASL